MNDEIFIKHDTNYNIFKALFINGDLESYITHGSMIPGNLIIIQAE